MAGHHNIAAATRHHARDATRTLATLGISQPGLVPGSGWIAGNDLLNSR
jgi:hypothetical protein